MKVLINATTDTNNQMSIKFADTKMTFGIAHKVYDLPRLKAEGHTWDSMKSQFDDFDKSSQTELKRLFNLGL